MRPKLGSRTCSGRPQACGAFGAPVVATTGGYASRRPCRPFPSQVMVTTSHSAPLRYDAPPGATVASWISSPNIDILSPQLYGPGTEKSPDFSTSGGVAWSQWAGARAPILPSVVDGSHYTPTATFFGSQGISIGGYVQWKETSGAGRNSSRRLR